MKFVQVLVALTATVGVSSAIQLAEAAPATRHAIVDVPKVEERQNKRRREYPLPLVIKDRVPYSAFQFPPLPLT